jgi:hypothetical protein
MPRLPVNQYFYRFFLSTLLSSLFFSALGQSKAKIIDWKLLSQVEFKDHYFEEYEAWYLLPVFSENVQKLDGKKVIIKGYVIPMDVEGGQYALSAYPFSACFFCGGAGPETVMSLQFKNTPPRYETDSYLNFTGTLKLNSTDFDQFNYILEDAQAISP